MARQQPPAAPVWGFSKPPASPAPHRTSLSGDPKPSLLTRQLSSATSGSGRASLEGGDDASGQVGPSPSASFSDEHYLDPSSSSQDDQTQLSGEDALDEELLAPGSSRPVPVPTHRLM